MLIITWSDHRVEQLKKLWEAGLSASQIAAELGNVTRNAVIGKVHRLGLAGRPKLVSFDRPPRERKPRMARFVQEPRRPTRVALALAEAVAVEATPTYDNVVPISQRLALVDLNEAVCHFPIGDPASPDFFFCGGKALPSLPYCAHHSRIAYEAPKPRRAEVYSRSRGQVNHDWRR
jgi:GcrA cell cycle regulator